MKGLGLGLRARMCEPGGPSALQDPRHDPEDIAEVELDLEDE